MHNSTYRMLKQLKEIREPTIQEKYLDKVYEWFRKQKIVAKNRKEAASAGQDFDKMTDNVDLIKNLTIQQN